MVFNTMFELAFGVIRVDGLLQKSAEPLRKLTVGIALRIGVARLHS